MTIINKNIIDESRDKLLTAVRYILKTNARYSGMRIKINDGRDKGKHYLVVDGEEVGAAIENVNYDNLDVGLKIVFINITPIEKYIEPINFNLRGINLLSEAEQLVALNAASQEIIELIDDTLVKSGHLDPV